MKTPRSKPPANRREGIRLPEARSRVSNGKDLLPNIDGRSLIARRYRDIASAIIVDQGGVGHCSEARQQLIRRFAAASVLAEQMEACLANGEEINVERHALLCSSLVRLSSRIGINRIARTITPSLDNYLTTDIRPVRTPRHDTVDVEVS